MAANSGAGLTGNTQTLTGTAAQIVGTVGADTHVNLTQINNTLVEHGGKEFDPDLEERRVKTTVKNWKRDARERLGIGGDAIAI